MAAAFIDQQSLVHAVWWLKQQGRVDSVHYKRLLRLCANARALEEGKRVHAHIARYGWHRDSRLAGLVVWMYGKCGNLDGAQAVFEEVQEPDGYLWHQIICAYAKQNKDAEALQLFRRMELEGIKAEEHVLSTVVGICGRLGAHVLGLALHDRILECGMCGHPWVGTQLLGMYAKWGRVEEAKAVFDSFGLCDEVSWSALLAAYAQNGHPRRVLQMLWRMDLEGIKPGHVTFITLLSACASLKAAAAGAEIHRRFLDSGLEQQQLCGGVVQNAILNMYGKCGDIPRAREVFDQIEVKTEVSWDSMLAAYVQNGHIHEGLKFFRRMELEGIKDCRVTFLMLLEVCSSLGAGNHSLHTRIAESGYLDSNPALKNGVISMHVKCGSLQLARKMFDGFQKRELALWTTMIAAYSQNGYPCEAVRLFRAMELEGVKPDAGCFSGVLDACSLLHGRQIHERIIKLGIQVDHLLGLNLLWMYLNHDQIEDARQVLESVPGADYSMWNAMIMWYTGHGQYKEALVLGRKIELEGLKMHITTFTNLLSTCTAAQDFKQGKLLHARMVETGAVLNSTAKTALVRFYGKVGDLSQARYLFDGIRDSEEMSWTTMMAAYAEQGCSHEAFGLFSEMVLDGIAPSEVTFLHILFACSHAGLVWEACEYFRAMVEDHELVPVKEHFGCLIDVFARAGKLGLAMELIESQPFENSRVLYMALARACKAQGDAELGEDVARSMLKLHSEVTTAESYAMLQAVDASLSNRCRSNVSLVS